MDIIDLGPAAQRLAGLITGARDGDLGRPTPCPAYTLGDLIDHVGLLALAFTAAARKERSPYVEQPRPGDASMLPADWRTRIPREAATLAGRLPDPRSAGRHGKQASELAGGRGRAGAGLVQHGEHDVVCPRLQVLAGPRHDRPGVAPGHQLVNEPVAQAADVGAGEA